MTLKYQEHQIGIADEIGFPYDPRIMGKALANGFPISLIIGNSEVISLARKLRISITFSKEMFSINAALAAMEIMETENGFKLVADLVKLVSESINKGLQLANVDGYASAVPLFDGSMFEVCISQNISNSSSLCESLKNSFFKNKVLILSSNPSFICLQHGELDFDELTDSEYKAGYEWVSQITLPMY